jgi:thymidylate kinase
MTTVALVGSDGAGKSRVADELRRSFGHPIKVVYLGMNPDSGRFALPTTRLSHAVKKRRVAARTGTGSSTPISLHAIEHRKDTRGSLWAAARLVNRIAEEAVKYLVSLSYRAAGAIVIYDRHYLFDFTPSSDRPQRLTSRIHLWFLEHVYPKPDLFILLDAPPEILLKRKQEVPISYLVSRRDAFLRRGGGLPNFAIVNADRPFPEVYRDVAEHLERLVGTRRRTEPSDEMDEKHT